MLRNEAVRPPLTSKRDNLDGHLVRCGGILIGHLVTRLIQKARAISNAPPRLNFFVSQSY